MKPGQEAKKFGFDVLLFLDSKEQKYIEEFSTSNFIALTAPDANGKRTYVTPKSRSVLASITNQSLAELAQKFGWSVERRQVSWDELGSFSEAAACGTAVIVTPISHISKQIPKPNLDLDLEEISDSEFDLESVNFTDGYDGLRQLHDAYRAIQTGEHEDDLGWMWPEEGL